MKVRYTKEFRLNNIKSDDILNVTRTKMQVRRGFCDRDDLQDVINDIEEKGGEVQILDNFLSKQRLVELVYYSQIRKKLNI